MSLFLDVCFKLLALLILHQLFSFYMNKVYAVPIICWGRPYNGQCFNQNSSMESFDGQVRTTDGPSGTSSSIFVGSNG